LGQKDIFQLHQIYRKLLELEKDHGWGFKFDVDEGYFETAIIFHQEQYLYRRPHPRETWKDLNDLENMVCPDILDYKNKIIFEFEEETGNRRSGAYLARKGHGHPGDLPSIKDSKRNSFYSNNRFRLCRIWESELKGDFGKKISDFLSDCYSQLDTKKYEK